MSEQFEELKLKVSKAGRERYKHYRLWQKFESEHNKLQQELEKLCEHKWEIDRTEYDPCHTRYECKKCGANY